MKEIKLNDNVLKLKESSTLAINHEVQKLRKKGESVIHFGFGQSPFPVPEIVVDEVKKNASCKDYLPTAGLFELREEISGYLKRTHDQNFLPENILIGPGSKELIFQLLYLLEGDVILPAPSWVSYKPQITLRHERIKILQTKKENNYKVQPDELEEFCKTLSSDQKVMIINNPNNPTGHLYDEKLMVEISEVCTRNNIIVISDEIYSQITFADKDYNSFTDFIPERTIVTSGLSKIFSAGGYRLGFVCIPQEMKNLISPLCSMFSETFSSVSAPIQFGAIAAYRESEKINKYIDDCTKIHKEASKYLYKRFIEMGIECSFPEGAFYMMIDFNNYRSKLKKNSISTILALTTTLLREKGVAILPGTDFYMEEDSLTARVATVDYDGELLLSKVVKKKVINSNFIIENCPNLKEGCDRIQDFLEDL